MATEIDKRVVEMQFDNKNFEKNCQASLNTLEKLKMALNFDGAKGLETMAKAADKVDLSHLSKAADEVTVKFSAMNIAGMTAISELTKSLINFGKNIWSNTFGQIKTGGMARTLKIEQANFQMRALAGNMYDVEKEADKIDALLDSMGNSIDKAVKGTAYGYDAAAAVTAQLMASGLQDADKMYNHLRAIAGAASMTGRSFEDIGNIFTTVASNGRLMTMQLRQFSAAGLNASAVLANYLNTTEEAINEAVTKGLIDFETFSDAIYKSFGEAAGEADKTFTGVTTNIKAQLSKIGQLFTDPFVKYIVPVLQTVKKSISSFNTVLKPIANTWSKLFKYMTQGWNEALQSLDIARLQPIADGVQNILVSIIMIAHNIKEAFKEVFPRKTLDELTKTAAAFESFTYNLIPTQDTLNALKEIVRPLFYILKGLSSVLNSIITRFIRPVFITISKLLGAIIRLFNALKPITDILFTVKSEGGIISGILDALALAVVSIVNGLTALVEILGVILRQITNSGLLKGVVSVLKIIGQLIGQVIFYALYIIARLINDIFSNLNVDNLVLILSWVENGLGIIAKIMSIVIDSFGLFIKNLSNGSGIIKAFIDAFNKGLENLKEFLGWGVNGTEKFTIMMEALVEELKALYEHIKMIFAELTPGKVILIGFGVAVIAIMLSIKMLIDATTGLVKNVSSTISIFTSLKKALSNISTYKTSVQFILSLTLAIVMFTSAIMTLAEGDQDKIKFAATIIGAFAGSLMAFALIMQKLQPMLGDKSILGISNVATIMAGAAISIRLIASSIMELSKVTVTLDKAIPAMGAVITLMLAFAATVAILASTSSKSVSKFADAKNGIVSTQEVVNTSITTMLGLAFSIKILVGAVNSIANMNTEGLKKNFWALIATIAAFTASLAAVGVAGFGSGAGFGALAFVAGLYLIVSLINKLATSFDYSKMLSGLAMMGSILAPILIFVGILGTITKKMGGSTATVAVYRLLNSITKAVLASIAAVVILGLIPESVLRKGLAGVTGLTILFAAISKGLFKVIAATAKDVRLISEKSLDSIAKIIKKVGECMILLSIAATVMNFAEDGSIWRVVIGMVAIGAVVAGIVAASKLTKDVKMGPIIGVLYGVTVIMGMMALLSFIPNIAEFEEIGFTIAVVLTAVAAVIASYSLINKQVEKEVKSSVTGIKIQNYLLEVALVLAAVAGIVASIGLLNSKEQLYLAAGILGGGFIALLVSIELIFAKINHIKSYKETYALTGVNKMLLSFAAFLASFGVIIAAVSLSLRGLNAGQTIALLGALVAILATFFLFTDKLLGTTTKIDVSGINDIVKGIFAVAGAMSVIMLSISAMLLATRNISGKRLVASLAIVSVAMLSIFAIFSVLIYKLSQLVFNEKTLEGFIKNLQALGNTMIKLGAMIAIIAAAIGALTVISSLLVNENNIGGALISLGALAIIYFGTLKTLWDASKDLKAKQVKSFNKMAVSLLAASAAIGVMAVSIIAIVSVSDKFSAHPISSLLMLVGMVVSVIVLLNTLVSAGNKLEDNKVNNLDTIAKALIIASGSLLVISGSIALMSLASNINDQTSKAIWQMIAAVIAIMTGLGIIATLNNDPKVIIATAAAIALASSSLLIVSKAITMLASTNIASNAQSLDSWIALMNKLAGLMTIMTIVGGAIGAVANVFGGEGLLKGIAIGVGIIVGAFTVFAAGVALFAKAINELVDASIKLNNIKLDAQRIADNLTAIFGGVLTAIKNVMWDILVVVGTVVAAIFVVIEALKIKAALEAGATAIAFMTGLIAALPAILTLFGVLMDEVISWCESEDNMSKVKRFFSYVAEILTSVIIGALEGVFKALETKFNNLATLAKKLEWETTQNGKTVYNSNKYLASKDKMTDTRALRERNTPTYNKSFHELEETLDMRSEHTAEYLYSKYKDLTEEGDLKTADYITRLYIDKVKDYDEKQWDELGRLMAQGVIQTNQGLSDVSVDFYKNLAEAIGMPVEAMGYLDTAISTNATTWNQALKNLQQVKDNHVKLKEEQEQTAIKMEEETVELTALGESMDGTSSKVDTLVKKETEAKEATEALENETSKASITIGGTVFDLSHLKLPSRNTVMEIAGNLGGTFGNVFSKKVGEGTVSGILDADVWKKIASGEMSLADAVGQAVGKTMGISTAKSYAEWFKKGSEIVTNKSGKKVEYYTTQVNDLGEAYKSCAEYAQDMERKSTKGLNVSGESLIDMLGVTDELTESTSLGTDAMTNFSESISDVGKSAEKTKSKLEDFTDGIKDSVKSSLHNIFSEVQDEEIVSPQEMLYRLEEHTRAIGEWARNISILAARGMSEGLLNELKDLGPSGASEVKSFVLMTDKELQQANQRYSAAAAMPDVVSKTIVDSYKDAGFNASLGFKEGINPRIAELQMRNLASNSLYALEDELDINSPSRKTMKDGEYVTEGFAIGITDDKSVGIIRKAGIRIADILLSSMKSGLNFNRLASFGEYSIQGLVSGFTNMFPTASKAISDLAQRIANIFPSKWKINSPSKLFEDFGLYAMLGLGKGFETGTDKTSDILTKDSENVINMMKKNLNDALSNVSEDSVYRPTIQPVFDLSALDAGFNNIQSWFTNNPGLNLNGNIQNLTPTNRVYKDSGVSLEEALRKFSEDRESKEQSQIEELKSLRNDISGLKDSMTHMKVVMNSGALVGQLIEDIDRGLGNRVVRNQRGRY